MSENIIKIIFQGSSEQLDKKLKDVGAKLDKFNKKAGKLGATLSTRLSLPLAIAGGAAIKLASDFEESLNKVDVAFGNSSKQVKDFAKTTLQEFGIAEGSALDMAALFGDMATSMGLSQQAAVGMSKELVGLAGDLASFKNIDIEQATTALAGVFTGETESLKRLGIVMTEVNLQQFAMEKGLDKSVKTMTQAEKVALRYEFIMSKTANAQGDFSRTSDGAANQMRIFQESLKELGVSFGQVLLPAFTKMVTKLNDILQSINNLSPGMKGFITTIGVLAAAVGPLLMAIPQLTTGFKLLTTAMKANPIIAVASALVTVATAIYSIADAKKQAKLDEFGDTIKKMSEDEALSKLKELNSVLEENNKIIQGSATIAAKSTAKKENKELKEKIKILDNQINSLRANAQAERELQQELKKGTKETNNNARAKVSAVSAFDQTITKTKELNLQTGKIETLYKRANDSLHEFGASAEIVGTTLETSLKEPMVNMANQVSQLEQVMRMIGEETAYILMDSFRALMEGESFFKTLGKAVLGLVKQLIAAIAAAAVLSIILGGLGIGKGFGGDFGSKFKNIFGMLSGFGGKGKMQTFAKGGIISTPTMGLMGEYPGARSNPEIVAPLDKLQGMIAQTGGNNVNVAGQFVLKGQDLVVALQRANRNRDRIN